MTRTSLAGIEKRVAAATEGPLEVWLNRDGTIIVCDRFEQPMTRDDVRFIAHTRTDLPALTAAVRDVLALHVEATCSRGYPQAYCMDCGQAWPCTTVRALAAHLDLTDPEGDPT